MCVCGDLYEVNLCRGVGGRTYPRDILEGLLVPRTGAFNRLSLSDPLYHEEVCVF